jgi:ABC-type multidrug transport system fused ATPase/permease subunit
MGWTFLPGLVLFFVFMFINLLVVKKGLHFLKEFMKVRGVRIKRTNEVFNNIKLIKSYSLERFFLKKIIDIRGTELNWLKLLFYRNIFTMVNANIGPGVFLLTIFAVHVAAGNQLTSGKIFTTISVFNSFIWALNYLPNIFTNFIDMLTSSERLTNYLLSPQIEKWPNRFDEKVLLNSEMNAPNVKDLFKEEYRSKVEERSEFIKKMEKEYFDPQDGKEVALLADVPLDEKPSLFNANYDIKEKPVNDTWELNSDLRGSFAGSLFDIQIKNLDFFWKKFWIPKTEEEKEKEKKEKEKKEKMRILMKKKAEENKETKEDKNENKSQKSDDSSSSIDDRFHLKNVNLEIKKGEFVCIIGKSGSGKSSLFLSILGELFARPANSIDPEVSFDTSHLNESSEDTKLPITNVTEDFDEITKTESTQLNYNHHLSYLSQKPWIRNATLKENIIFGLPFDEKRYNESIEYSGLTDDLKILKDGDNTVIGDKGINLSGGQKVRVGLARALYSGSEMYLLDDPISALDVNVGNHVFMKAFKGYLRNRTRLVITHSLGYLKHFDRIIFMEKGSIMYDGSYEGIQDKEFYIGIFLLNFINF